MFRNLMRFLRGGGRFHRHTCRCGATWRCGIPADECRVFECEDCERAWHEAEVEFDEYLMSKCVKALQGHATPRVH